MLLKAVMIKKHSKFFTCLIAVVFIYSVFTSMCACASDCIPSNTAQNTEISLSNNDFCADTSNNKKSDGSHDHTTTESHCCHTGHCSMFFSKIPNTQFKLPTLSKFGMENNSLFISFYASKNKKPPKSYLFS